MAHATQAHSPAGTQSEEWSYKRLRLQGLISLGRLLIQVAGAVVIVYLIYLMVRALAGETTSANIAMQFLANVHIHTMSAWMFGLGGVVYGANQKRLRKMAIQRLSARVRELEQEMDPMRSSSMLTPRGDTHPEDRL